MVHEGEFVIHTYGKPQIKPASTCSSANSSKDSPTLSDVEQPSCCPTYPAMYSYVAYIIGERNVAKRIVGVLSSICYSLCPASRAKPFMAGATLAVALAFCHNLTSPSTFPISKKLFILLLYIR